MTQLIAELYPEQRTAIRLSTRDRLLRLVQDRMAAGSFVTRPLSPLDFVGQYVGGEPVRARLHTGAIEAGRWQTVARLRLTPWAAVAVWGYAAYSSSSQIDVIRFALSDGMYTLAELPLGELIAIERRDPTRIRRRSGWLDPPVTAAPTQSLDVAVISDAGIPVDETFTLLGAVCELAGVRVMPDQANLV